MAEKKAVENKSETALREEGVVAGGGVVFLHAIDAVVASRDKAAGDEKIGVDIVVKALRTPAMQIASNSGADGAVVVEEILERGNNIGYNAATGEYVDMVKSGIIDPAKVGRTALQNAASMAGLMLTTNVMVTDYDEKKVEDGEEQAIAGAIT